MPVVPKIDGGSGSGKSKTCSICHNILPLGEFAYTHSSLFPDGHSNICNECAGSYLRENEYGWQAVDKLCQLCDLPFMVKEWDRIVENAGQDNAWPTYTKVFQDDCYISLGWKDYFDQYKKLKEVGLIEEEIPYLHEHKIQTLQRQWGANYSEEELMRLEDLYKGIKATQNVASPLQEDQAEKLCKLSLEIDSRIRAGDKDVDKFLASYEKIVRMADFTSKNTKNATDFDSFAEVAVWLEKRGMQNHFYDNVTRDVIDETLKNIENWNQRLYVNEGGIGEEITERLQALKVADQKEQSIYDVQVSFDSDQYDNEAFLVEDGEEDEFNPGGPQ